MRRAGRWTTAVAAGISIAMVVVPPEARARTSGPAAAPRAAVRDSLRHSDGNRVNLLVTNLGIMGYDGTTAGSGCFWPIGSGQSPLFAAGLWIGARVAGAVRVAIAEYASEYTPGPMFAGAPLYPEDLRNHVYKMMPWTGNPADSAHVSRGPAEMAADPNLDPLLHHGWTEYWEGTYPGGPKRFWRLPNPATPAPGDSIDILGPAVTGDRMLWAVYNDSDPARHATGPGSTAPLGVEVQQSTFTFSGADALTNTVFFRYRIINNGSNTLDSTFVALWSDPDVGGAGDDAVGCDTTRALGYAYNAFASDLVYGTPPPAIGFTLLQGPVDPVSGDTLGMTTFISYVGGNDPAAAAESYRLMRGVNRDGRAQIDPFTSLPVTRYAPGDPVRGVGWTDSLAGERKMIVGSGPFRMAPGDTQVVIAAMVIGRGGDHLASVGVLRCEADAARDLYRARFDASGFAAAPACSTRSDLTTTNCPRSSEFWRDEVAFNGALLTAAQLEQVAQAVDSSATSFDWGSPPKFDDFRAVMDPPLLNTRHAAEREYAALLANLWAGRRGLLTTGGEEIWANPLLSTSCPGLAARTVGELAERADLTPRFVDAQYLNTDATHRRAIEGIDVGLPSFQAGAGPAHAFPGSALDPAVQPDSFGTVEVRFSRTSTQRAYRWLRLERQSDGTAPPQGRGYLYGGFRTVPFTVWDVTGNRQLEAGFVERALTDDAGTLLPRTSQPASFDSTWAPDTSHSGAGEWLLVFHRDANRTTPAPGLAVDGLPVSPAAPTLYAVVPRLRSPTDVIDDGDVLRFLWGAPRTPGVDSLLIGLATQSPDDPAVHAAYQNIAACLATFNAGVGATCSGQVPAAISVQSVLAERTHVSITWYTATGIVASIERRFEGGAWVPLATQFAGPGSTLLYDDTDVTPGGRYDYRLIVTPPGGSPSAFGGLSVVVPGESALRFSGARPNPATADLVLAFSLATRDRARLELLDVLGRRVLERDLIGLGPGEHTVSLGDVARFRAGVYMVRITQGGRRSSGKVALVH